MCYIFQIGGVLYRSFKFLLASPIAYLSMSHFTCNPNKLILAHVLVSIFPRLHISIVFAFRFINNPFYHQRVFLSFLWPILSLQQQPTNPLSALIVVGIYIAYILFLNNNNKKQYLPLCFFVVVKYLQTMMTLTDICEELLSIFTS